MESGYEKRGYLVEDFRLFHLKDANGTKMEFHYHEFYKVVFLISGAGGYTVEGNAYRLEAGDVLLIKSREVHRPEFEKGVPYERIILYISPEFLGKYSAGEDSLEAVFEDGTGHVLKLKEKERNSLLELMERLERELDTEQKFAKEVMANSLLLQLLVDIGRRKKKRRDVRQDPTLVEDERICGVMRYIDGHLAEDIDINMLSEQFFLSRYHLMRLFKKETGQTIYEYLLEQRLQLAKELIRQGKSATESCFAAGFGSYSSFTRAYGKKYGTTPTGRNGRCIFMDEAYEEETL